MPSGEKFFLSGNCGVAGVERELGGPAFAVDVWQAAEPAKAAAVSVIAFRRVSFICGSNFPYHYRIAAINGKSPVQIPAPAVRGELIFLMCTNDCIVFSALRRTISLCT